MTRPSNFVFKQHTPRHRMCESKTPRKKRLKKTPHNFTIHNSRSHHYCPGATLSERCNAFVESGYDLTFAGSKRNTATVKLRPLRTTLVHEIPSISIAFNTIHVAHLIHTVTPINHSATFSLKMATLFRVLLEDAPCVCAHACDACDAVCCGVV